jgi:hypothetical protein
MSWATPLAGFEVTQLVGFQLAEGPASTFWCKAQKKASRAHGPGRLFALLRRPYTKIDISTQQSLQFRSSAVPQFRISKSE